MRMLTLLLLVGCFGGSSSDDDDDDDDKTDDETTSTSETEPPPAFVPAEGDWTVIDGTITEDSCNIQDLAGGDTGTGEPAIFTVSGANKNGFQLSAPVADSVETFDCSLTQSDLSFTCPSRQVELDLAPDLPGNKLIFDVTATGVFQVETHMMADQASVINCQGPDCGMMEDLGGLNFPCSLGVHSTASLE